jgi:hypothetical protein
MSSFADLLAEAPHVPERDLVSIKWTTLLLVGVFTMLWSAYKLLESEWHRTLVSKRVKKKD